MVAATAPQTTTRASAGARSPWRARRPSVPPLAIGTVPTALTSWEEQPPTAAWPGLRRVCLCGHPFLPDPISARRLPGLVAALRTRLPVPTVLTSWEPPTAVWRSWMAPRAGLRRASLRGQPYLPGPTHAHRGDLTAIPTRRAQRDSSTAAPGRPAVIISSDRLLSRRPGRAS